MAGWRIGANSVQCTSIDEAGGWNGPECSEPDGPACV